MTKRHCTLTMAMLVATATLAGCRSQTASPASESATLNVTSWTDKTELYMEYPPLVANQSVRFAVHLTRLGDFKALNEGRPSLEFTPAAGGSATVLPGSPPLRPGAFRVEGGPIANRITALARFGRLFLGKLWDVYGQQVLPFGPI